ncbi:thioredoxin family protein [Halomarina salina]|uniref:Thioredoxin family protein n=1 Tax=Halomarina salina TaxID=1872699 RepID=A0ABD5RHY4_9EURY|nr:thioredoxin family protein [Halomarina salina]
MSGDDATAESTPAADSERLLDALVDGGVLVERPDGRLATSESFESTHDIYHDSYATSTDEDFQRAVSDVFDLPPEAAAERIEEEGVTREMLVTYLAVQSELDGSYSTGELARMATMVGDIAPESPIPPAVDSLDDETYEAFVSTNDRAAITVWRRHCAPCKAVKRDLDDVLAAIPDEVAVGGVDGESVTAFRSAYDVNAAPSLLLFEDGEHVETLQGRFTADQVAEAYESLGG